MPIAKSGDLNQIIKIVLPGKSETDEYGDSIPGPYKIIYPKLYSMQRTKKADEIASDIKSLRDQVQFVIRHRMRTEPLISSDMHVIQMILGKEVDYQIKAIDYDSQYQQWDVLICERIGDV